MMWEEDRGKRGSYDTARFRNSDDLIWDHGWIFYLRSVGIANHYGVEKRPGQDRFRIGSNYCYVFRNQDDGNKSWSTVLYNRGYVIVRVTR
jgi:hypothetical protein